MNCLISTLESCCFYRPMVQSPLLSCLSWPLALEIKDLVHISFTVFSNCWQTKMSCRAKWSRLAHREQSLFSFSKTTNTFSALDTFCSLKWHLLNALNVCSLHNTQQSDKNHVFHFKTLPKTPHGQYYVPPGQASQWVIFTLFAVMEISLGCMFVFLLHVCFSEGLRDTAMVEEEARCSSGYRKLPL